MIKKHSNHDSLVYKALMPLIKEAQPLKPSIKIKIFIFDNDRIGYGDANKEGVSYIAYVTDPDWGSKISRHNYPYPRTEDGKQIHVNSQSDPKASEQEALKDLRQKLSYLSEELPEFEITERTNKSSTSSMSSSSGMQSSSNESPALPKV